METKTEYKKLVEQVIAWKKSQGMDARKSAIGKELGYNVSYFSTLVGGSGEVTEDHIKMLKLQYPFLDHQNNLQNVLTELTKSIKLLYHASNALKDAQLSLAKSCEALIKFIEPKK